MFEVSELAPELHNSSLWIVCLTETLGTVFRNHERTICPLVVEKYAIFSDLGKSKQNGIGPEVSEKEGAKTR